MSVSKNRKRNLNQIRHLHLLNTKQKIGLASLMYGLVRIFRGGLLGKSNQSICKRNGISWDLDLKEGIDFSIWLLGGFELQTIRLYETLIKDEDIIFDIGANIGAHTLPLARLAGQDGLVYAFEPTDFAFQKLTRNLSLNPDLAGRVKIIQAMLIDDVNTKQSPSSLYSSWPLTAHKDLHKQHRGRLMNIDGANIMTLDDFVNKMLIDRVNFIKIDVDGNEVDVLQGGWNTIQKFRPDILMEFAPYLFEINRSRMEMLFDNLMSLGYDVREASSLKLLPNNLLSLESYVPDFGSINILLQKQENNQ